MGLPTLLKLTVALLTAAGLSAFLVAGISADDENEEAVATRNLQPTEVVAEIPEEYGVPFRIQWGGGTLYHLKARLATMGCMLNSVYIHDDAQWFSYNQYNVPYSLNTSFLTQFPDAIPPTTLYGTCIDICTFDTADGVVIGDKRCITFEELREQGALKEFKEILNLPIDDNTTCNDDFSPLVKQYIFPILPILPDTCIVRQTTMNTPNVRGRIGGGDHPASVWYVVLWSNPSLFKSEEAEGALRIYELHVEIHELCHVQQDYYVVQQETLGPRFHPWYGWYGWYGTEANKEFMKLTGFTEITKRDVWDFRLPDDSIFKEIYSINPAELSAELCAIYLIDKMGEESRYAKLPYKLLDNPEAGIQIQIAPFNPRRYLTLEIRQWLETYMILPDISE